MGTDQRGSNFCFLTLCCLMLSQYWPSCRADSSVLIRSVYGQGLTSSTLRWITMDGGNRAKLPRDVVIAGTGLGGEEVYVCRARHSGHWLLGSSNGESCRVVFFDKIFDSNRFDVLVNPDQAARLEWVAWDKHRRIATGTVEDSGAYVARHKMDGSWFVGSLDPTTKSQGRIFLAIQDVVRVETEGEILVEYEPTEYAIDQMAYNDKKRQENARSDVVLYTTTLENAEATEDIRMSTVVFYNVPYSVYLGHLRGMSKGLATKVVVPDLEVSLLTNWGLAANGSVTRNMELSAVLAYGTAVNASIIGSRVTVDIPYTAELTSFYGNRSQPVARPINGTTRQTLIRDIKLVWSPAYFIMNGSLVPTTTSTSTSTTTTTSPTTPEPSTTTISQYPMDDDFTADGDFDKDASDQPQDYDKDADTKARSVEKEKTHHTHSKDMEVTMSTKEAAWIKSDNSAPAESTRFLAVTILLSALTLRIMR